MPGPPLPATSSWGRVGPPVPPRDEPTTVEVTDAFLTPVRRGDLRVLERPTRWMRGAVHDADGELVVASQKIGGLGGGQIAQADPRRVTVGRDAPRLEGTWLYGGHWMRHFGHFITETVSTLWPTDPVDASELGGLVFHAYFADTPEEPAPWQEELLALAGFAGVPVRVVHRSAVAVERLLVPSRAVTLNGWAHPEAVSVWRRMAANAGAADGGAADGPERVFLSRSAFNSGGGNPRQERRTDPTWDRAVDRVFAEHGFAVVHPQALAVAEQVRLVAGARVLAGVSGSALHLSVFGPPEQRVLELGDRRSPDRAVPMQVAVDAACGHERAFVPHGAVEDLRLALGQLALDVPTTEGGPRG